jgi:hypothetical protein
MKNSTILREIDYVPALPSFPCKLIPSNRAADFCSKFIRMHDLLRSPRPSATSNEELHSHPGPSSLVPPAWTAIPQLPLQVKASRLLYSQVPERLALGGTMPSLFQPPSDSSRNYLRRGEWTREEEMYAKRMIDAFNKGYLKIPHGATLRSFLAERLFW